MSDWIKDTLCQRLEMLTENAEKLDDVLLLKNKINQLEQFFSYKLWNIGEEEMHREWMDVHKQLQSLQQGWFYAKGVQDGVKMAVFLQKSEQELSVFDGE
ncbi:hypothetical protein [Paenibacillus sp. S-12]|uniref:hypothetical protein n=1 Tax=Paenibacillus sp. S-12 TaxID=3031371 RepID=UPI0025A28DC4|nr:hypothetical protein [Paenibacillus sp. S-12]